MFVFKFWKIAILVVDYLWKSEDWAWIDWKVTTSLHGVDWKCALWRYTIADLTSWSLNAVDMFTQTKNDEMKKIEIAKRKRVDDAFIGWKLLTSRLSRSEYHSYRLCSLFSVAKGIDARVFCKKFSTGINGDSHNFRLKCSLSRLCGLLCSRQNFRNNSLLYIIHDSN